LSGDATGDGGALKLAGLGFMGCVLIYGGARFLSNALPQVRDSFFVRVTQNMNRVVAQEAFLHAQKQSLHFHLSRRAGALNRIIERGSGAMEFLLRFLVFNIGPTFVELAMAAGVIGVLYGPWLSVVALLTVVAYTVFTVLITEWRNRLRRAMNEADTELKAVTMDTFTNFETVKAFAAEEREAARFDGAMRQFIHHFIRSMKSMNLMNMGQEFIMTAGLVGVAVAAGFAVQQSAMRVGDIMAVILMMTNIYRPLNILGFAWREIKQSSVDVEKLYDLLDEAPSVADVPGAGPLISKDGAIAFEDVSFAYEGRAQSLDKVSFAIEPGQFVGVVGPSGAGKSTLVKLLFRFYDPTAGRIIIDGTDIRTVTQASLRTALSLVPQDVSLFNDSLRVNIAYGCPDASDAAIQAALERAQLASFVETLPKGLETVVGERGLKLSGGERQRVGLARAILNDPCILVLDEATSSLDSATEEDVQHALMAAARGRTTISIAHRLSTVAGADHILVLDKGRIAETGTHAALIAQGGLYAGLWQKQSIENDRPIGAGPVGEPIPEAVSLSR
ncbi:MAG: ABC transporter ATP-binding protein/permease, partial [Pseudomonadota bacterium]